METQVQKEEEKINKENLQNEENKNKNEEQNQNNKNNINNNNIIINNNDADLNQEGEINNEQEEQKKNENYYDSIPSKMPQSEYQFQNKNQELKNKENYDDSLPSKKPANEFTENEVRQNLYFEKQSLKLCGKHCLNNLFQKHEFTKSYLDNLCEELTKTKTFQLNPHKTCFWGNYDINLLELALIRKGYVLKWFDKRKCVEEIKFGDNVLGLILNIKIKGVISDTQHYTAVKNIQGHYVIFDSKNDKPTFINQEKLYKYLQNEVINYDKKNNIFIVEKQQEQNQFQA